MFLTRDAYRELGGYDERFDLPGGGLVNLDFYRRSVLRERSENIVLLGEGTFHQIHGGVATNEREESLEEWFALWSAQYRKIRGQEFEPPQKTPLYLGGVPRSALPSVESSARKAVEFGAGRP